MTQTDASGVRRTLRGRSEIQHPIPCAVGMIDNSQQPVGILANMKAELLQRERLDFDDARS